MDLTSGLLDSIQIPIIILTPLHPLGHLIQMINHLPRRLDVVPATRKIPIKPLRLVKVVHVFFLPAFDDIIRQVLVPFRVAEGEERLSLFNASHEVCHLLLV